MPKIEILLIFEVIGKKEHSQKLIIILKIVLIRNQWMTHPASAKAVRELPPTPAATQMQLLAVVVVEEGAGLTSEIYLHLHYLPLYGSRDNTERAERAEGRFFFDSCWSGKVFRVTSSAKWILIGFGVT